MNWSHDPRPAGVFKTDVMTLSSDPNYAYPMLDIFAQKSTSPYRNVLMNTNTPPRIRDNPRAKRPNWSAA